MAKSKSFFGLRTGSTKSHTFQIYRGVQVTKDRVSEVSNPQTSMQMNQRLLLPLVANAASQLYGLVNHSFEGVDYGYKSVGKFRALNLTKGNLNVRSYVPKGAMDCGEADFIVSRGSLQSFDIEAATGTGNTVAVNNFSEASVKASELTGSTAKKGVISVLKQAFGLADDDQISFLTQHPVGSYTYQYNDEKKTGTRHGFILSRLILNEAELENWTITPNDTTDNSNVVLTDGYTVVTLTGKTDADGNNDIYSGMTFSIMGQNVPAPQQVVCSAAMILSRKVNNSWKRSSQRLVEIGDQHVIEYDEALHGYIKNNAASSKFLNTGNDPTGIAGDYNSK